MISWVQKRARKIFFESLRDLRDGYLEIVCPEETFTFGRANADLRAMAVVHDERFFVRALLGADIGMGESYMDGDWTTPDLVALVRVAVRNLRTLDAEHKFLSSLRAFASRVRHKLRANTIAGSRKNIRAHYDLGNEFYELFLDSQMMYSSAYFRERGRFAGGGTAGKDRSGMPQIGFAGGRSGAGDRMRVGIVCDSRGAKLRSACYGGDDQSGAVCGGDRARQQCESNDRVGASRDAGLPQA